MVMAEVPVFFTVTVWAALVVFTSWFPKLSGDPVNEIALPSPVKLTVLTWLKKPFVLMVMLPRRFPEAVGAKYTYIVQVVPLAIEDGQSSASLKFVLAGILLMVSGP